MNVKEKDTDIIVEQAKTVVWGAIRWRYVLPGKVNLRG